MVYTDRVKKAMLIAYRAHSKQVDKGGYPYIAHPIHIAECCETESETVVALLHDVLEDNPSYRKRIERLLTGYEWEAILALTRNDTETYKEYIKRVSKNRLATKIKCLDLKHNLDSSRITEPYACEDLPKSLVDRYTNALDFLEATLKEHLILQRY